MSSLILKKTHSELLSLNISLLIMFSLTTVNGLPQRFSVLSHLYRTKSSERNSEFFFIVGFSQVSVPITMSGSIFSSITDSTSRLFMVPWKLTTIFFHWALVFLSVPWVIQDTSNLYKDLLCIALFINDHGKNRNNRGLGNGIQTPKGTKTRQ